MFGVMYSLSGSVSYISGNDTAMKSVIWPDFVKLPIGLLISLAGLVIGMLIRKKQKNNT